MVSRWLIQEWIAQWLGLRDRLRAEGVRDHDRWWLGIRERILRFMVSRYLDDHPEEAAALRDEPAPESTPQPPPLPLEARRTFCRASVSNAYGPRRCVEMEGKLRRVSQINQYKRPRWRWL